ncbi:MAG: MarR family transcriptional regulator [Candidatus Lokiarchaeota archaeon]|nr:MarR family transcriptional regulator [Candidatus Lokiarchaeota archaeon]
MAKSLPPSSFKILHLLQRKGPMSPKQIREFAKIPARTVAFALKRLLKTGMVQRIPNLQDMRKTLYHVEPKTIQKAVERHGVESIIGMQLTMLFR